MTVKILCASRKRFGRIEEQQFEVFLYVLHQLKDDVIGVVVIDEGRSFAQFDASYCSPFGRLFVGR